MGKDKIVLAGALAALACVLLWMILERLGLGGIAGNAITIFASLVFFLAALAQTPSSTAATADVRLQTEQRNLSSNLTMMLLIVFHLLNWNLLILLLDVLWDPVETAISQGLMILQPAGRGNVRAALGGTAYMFWSVPITIVFSAWLGIRVVQFTIWQAFIAVTVALGLFVIIRMFLDPSFFDQSRASLELLFNGPNPFVTALLR